MIVGHKRVLIAEDDSAVRRALVAVLRHANDVSATGSGQEALDRLLADDYDLVLCDVKMPYVSGADVYRRVRRQKPHLASRFVFLGGDRGDRSEAGDLGRPMLEKPVRRQRLFDVLRSVEDEGER